MIPSARLYVALLALGVPALIAGFQPGLWPWILSLDATLLVLAAVDAWAARAPDVTVERLLPERLSVGVENPITLEVHFRGPRALRVRLRDSHPAVFQVDPPTLEQRFEPGVRVRLTQRVVPGQRGRFELGDLWIRVRGPLGLIWHERVLPARTEVSVYPDMRGASRLLLSGAALDLVNLGLRSLRRDGRGTEFARLRDYSQGDSVRDVAWKATARRGRPVTRVLETERSQTLLLCVEAGRTMTMELDGLRRLDHAVNAALFLAFVALRNGDRVGLTVFADTVKQWIPPGSGRDQYRRILEALYATHPERSFVDYPELARQVSLRLPHRALVCLFTELHDPEQAESLEGPLLQLGRRHIPLCLTLRDEGLEDVAMQMPEALEDAWLQAAASEALLERDALHTRIVRSGTQVLDADPERLGLVAVNRYLEIKARGAL